MGRNYVRKTNRRHNSPEDVLERAAALVIQNGLSIRGVAKNFGVNYQTLNRFVRLKKGRSSLHMGYQNCGTRVFTDEQEVIIGAYVKEAAEMFFFGLTPKDVRVLTYVCAKKNTGSLYPYHGRKIRWQVWSGFGHFASAETWLSEPLKLLVWAEQAGSTGTTLTNSWAPQS